MRRISMAMVLSLVAAFTLCAGCTRAPAPVSPVPVEAAVHHGLPSLSAVDMVNNGYSGWALTATGVYHTTDSGQNWEDVSPSLDRGMAIAVHDFLDTKTGWLLVTPTSTSESGRSKIVLVLCTVDGGQTWVRSEIRASEQAEYPSALTFTDAEHGWAMLSYGVACGSEGVEIFSTSDGGATWRARAAAKPWQAGEATSGVSPDHAIPFGGDKTGLAFRDSDNGWLTGNDPSSTPYFFTTHDGGVTWARQPLPVPRGLDTEGGASSPHPPVFFSPQEGILPVTFGEEAVLYATKDGGRTWSPTSATKGRVWSIVSMKDAFVTDGSTLYRTNDGGRSWVNVKLGQQMTGMMAVGYTIAQLDFTTDKAGWALLSAPGSSRLLKTTDGGLTWH